MLQPNLSDEKAVKVKSSDGNVRTSTHSYILTVKTIQGELISIPFRHNLNLGIQSPDNQIYVKTIIEELGIPPDKINEFNFFHKLYKLMGIIGLKNPCLMVTPVDSAALGLKQKPTSPDLEIFKSILCKEYFIIGRPGINPNGVYFFTAK